MRCGTAVAELAVCLPLIVTVTLGTIEACSMLHLQQKLETTAFEGARIGCVPDAEVINVTHQCQTLLDAQRVRGYTITLNPPDPESLQQGDFFEVTIEAPCSANSLLGGWFYAGRTLVGDVALTKE